MVISAIDIIGLVGVVIVISVGKVFDPLRDFLRSFTNKYNPSRWLADLLSCPMCSGIWVGAFWALLHQWSLDDVIVFSGLVSIFSFLANEILGLLGILTLRVSHGFTTLSSQRARSSAVALAGARKQVRTVSRKVAPGDNLTEDEADELIDAETEKADTLVIPSNPLL